MADGIRNGQIGLREAAANDTYATAIGTRFDTFWDHHENLDDQQRQQLRADGYRFVEDSG